MDLMALRRSLMMMPQSASESVGIFTKGYEATLKPGGTNSFVIQHNLGIIPRLCIVEVDSSTVQLASYTVWAIVDFDLNGARNDKTGVAGFVYHYNGADAGSSNYLPNTTVSVDENSIELKALHSTTRSPWDTSADYHVRVWGC